MFYVPISLGAEYDVLGVRIEGTEVVFDIPFPDGSLMLLPVPGEMVELIDGRVDGGWLLAITDGMATLGPPPIHSAFFHDRLSDGEPEAVAEYKRMLGSLGREP
jgi:hypothetical protein